MNRPSDKKEINCHDIKNYRSKRIIGKIQLFPFISIMEHTSSIIETYISLLPSLLKVFFMFQIRSLYHEHNDEEYVVEAIDIQCINCHRNTGLYLKVKTVEEIIT